MKKGAEKNNKVTFGRRKLGNHRKSSGPKAKMVKKYKGQGR